MQDTLVKKIRENLYSLVDVTSDLPELVKVFKDKGIFNDEDVEEIAKIDISFDKKTTFYWTVEKKGDEAFDLLVETFRSTGNDEGVKILEAPISAPVTVEADVTVESSNEEGRNIAESMEKEFDQIQSEESDETEIQSQGQEVPKGDEIERKSEIQVTQEFLKENKDEVTREEIEISPEESFEMKEDAEEFTREIIEEAEIQVQKQVEVEEVESPVRVEVTPPDTPEPEREEVAQVQEISKQEEVKESFQEEEEIVAEPKPKQVSFESQKEFTISKEDIDTPVKDELKSTKSIVAQNRELFEKSAPKGVKVRYSFKKEDATMTSVETPENKVSSLKNFFQNLGSNKAGSKDDSNAVERRGGNKLGGVHPNRRTVAS